MLICYAKWHMLAKKIQNRIIVLLIWPLLLLLLLAVVVILLLLTQIQILFKPIEYFLNQNYQNIWMTGNHVRMNLQPRINACKTPCFALLVHLLWDWYRSKVMLSAGGAILSPDLRPTSSTEAGKTLRRHWFVLLPTEPLRQPHFSSQHSFLLRRRIHLTIGCDPGW